MTVNFGCHAQASQLSEAAQASLPHLAVTKPKASAGDDSSSDTEDLLNSLFLSPACGSPSMHRRGGSDCELFESWP
jgi:hypothetical protein